MVFLISKQCNKREMGSTSGSFRCWSRFEFVQNGICGSPMEEVLEDDVHDHPLERPNVWSTLSNDSPVCSVETHELSSLQIETHIALFL